MKNLLLISYFWPPSGKATVHWPLFIAKYLKKYGWDTSVLTTEEDTFSQRDESLIKEVDPSLMIVKTKPYDPFRFYRKFIGKKEDEPLVASETISKVNNNWRHKIAVWIRMNLFVPDARVGWYLSAPKGGKHIIEEKNPSVIVTIGPPHSTHLIGMKLSKRHNIPHIPVLIDPWVDIAYYKGLKRNKGTITLDNIFERLVLNHAKSVVFVTKDTRNHYCAKYPNIKEKSYICYWGYNEEYFAKVVKQTTTKEIILHAGNIFDFQNPQHFWRAIRNRIENGKKLRIRFIGTVSPGIKQSIHESNLEEHTDYIGFLPYEEVVQEMMNASYLLVCATEPRHVPGKLFEYMRTGNRIIAFGNDNKEVEELLIKTNSGKVFSYNYDCNDIFTQLETLSPNPQSAIQFNREIIAKDFADILTRAVSC